MNLRVIIVDDERGARLRLRRLLGAEPEVEICAECANGDEALAAVAEHRPDVAFLDIRMPGRDGFDVVEALPPAVELAVVFVTAFEEHAVRAFEKCALDYLVKPVAKERLAQTLGRLRERVALTRTARTEGAAATVTATATPDQVKDAGDGVGRRFAVRTGSRTVFVAPEEIEWIEADGNYAVLHTGGERRHLIRETMATLEAQVSPALFMRVSRSAIVNLARVREIQSTPDGRHHAVMANGDKVGITRGVRDVADRLRTV